MSNTKDYDFSKLYKNRLEKRLVEYLEVVSGLYGKDLEQGVQAQVALVSKSIENIALMLAEQGYINNRGIFQRFSPSDLLTIQQALNAALKMRADIMMQPMGLEALTKNMAAVNSITTAGNNSGNPNTGLSEPPPLVAVDSKESVVEEEPGFGNIKEEPEVMVPVLLPAKIKS
jgi:hypothetical protein